ncbi:related to xeroderma pigmentosum group C complementing factor (homolog to excision repair protein RAD4) [Rhynchosporium secalis]|uniref:Related to xeroderma pigmentosum group C complementing factor (Homolog to excision repair protein RAD4) n=1 Tax=Rhynchosporium secalis TaxID=38038 RepID=A0A1E1M9R7_RHYSE|nr:related to xeroderma pigmentosum group C complementing factor (homolog to excision repair protein RAD4) [Rhynchosporium secalis]
MAGKKGARVKGNATATKSAVPDIYQDMLSEALPTQSEIPERPLKRRKTGRRDSPVARSSPAAKLEEEDEDLEFEDVLHTSLQDFGSEQDIPVKRQQTAYRDSDDESDDSDGEWQGLNLDAEPEDDEPSGDLDLTLIKKTIPQVKPAASRRRLIGKVEKSERLEKHKMYLLCLFSHLDWRNYWCNDSEVQKSLRPLLDKKMLTFLRPKESLSQFGRTDSLKRGLDSVAVMWRTRFSITARGLRRALWADDEKDLQNYRFDDGEILDKSDFRAAAKTLKGSRDLGAQLFCALLRSANVETRLVCSLQPLSFNSGGPAMAKFKPKPRETTPETTHRETCNPSTDFQFGTPGDAAAHLTSRRRLGHPSAAAYHMPEVSTPSRPLAKPKPKPIHESDYPTFWVEVFDEAHQKWFPVDPLVTESIAKPRSFEPPASDRENNMSYVIAFEEERCARDVTKRYVKAYNAKTRRNRVESTSGGERWWRRAMRPYGRGYKSDADQIEDTELTANVAKEPMPKNIADFKDHPIYALERHLKRNEILTSTRNCGRVAAGRDPNVPGGKKLEKIFRREHVKVGKSADAWYRLGREVKIGEQPVKTVPAKRRPDDMDFDDGRGDLEERAGTNLYTEEQTEIYEAPPIVNGRVPKNSYGNLDVYVPSMVPPGGVHLRDDETARAARLLSIDYSDALTGFSFRGRHGTAILQGAVIASEYREAVEAVIEGFRDERAQAEETRRTNVALRTWKLMLLKLRIKERVDAYKDPDEEEEEEDAGDLPDGMELEDSDDGGGTEDDGDDDYGGGGFIPE